jgi:hypothetical protein
MFSGYLLPMHLQEWKEIALHPIAEELSSNVNPRSRRGGVSDASPPRLLLLVVVLLLVDILKVVVAVV